MAGVELDAYLAGLDPLAATTATVTDKAELRKRIVAVRRDGYCFIDGEVERGIAGLATPIHDRDGQIIAALNLSLAFSRRTKKDIAQILLPKLAASTRHIESILHNDLPLR